MYLIKPYVFGRGFTWELWVYVIAKHSWLHKMCHPQSLTMLSWSKFAKSSRIDCPWRNVSILVIFNYSTHVRFKCRLMHTKLSKLYTSILEFGRKSRNFQTNWLILLISCDSLIDLAEDYIEIQDQRPTMHFYHMIGSIYSNIYLSKNNWNFLFLMHL